MADRVRVLVTGGAGFVGSHVVDACVARGFDTVVLDNFSSGSEQNIRHLNDKIHLVRGDIRNAADVKAAMDRCAAVIHLAANANVPRSVEDPRFDFSVNAEGMLNVVESACELKVRHLIFTSSAAVYGEPASVPVHESAALNPLSPYGASKVYGECMLKAFHACFGLNYTTMRLFNAYGPRQKHYVIYDLFKKLASNRDVLEVLGTGEQVRDYLYVTDAAKIMVSLLFQDAAMNRAVNLGAGQKISIKELAKAILRVAGCEKAELRFTGKSWKGDIRVLQPNITALKGLLPDFSFTPFDTGLGLFYAAFSDNSVS